jgi:hypothetical protein
MPDQVRHDEKSNLRQFQTYPEKALYLFRAMGLFFSFLNQCYCSDFRYSERALMSLAESWLVFPRVARMTVMPLRPLVNGTPRPEIGNFLQDAL